MRSSAEPGGDICRVVLALTGVAAGLVLHASWATIRAPFDAALALAVVVGVVYGVLGFIAALRIPVRLTPISVLTPMVLFGLFVALASERVGIEGPTLLAARVGAGIVVTTLAHVVASNWRGVGVLALPVCLSAAVLGANLIPGFTPTQGDDEVQLATGTTTDASLAEALTFPTDGPTAVSPASMPPVTAAATSSTKAQAKPAAVTKSVSTLRPVSTLGATTQPATKAAPTTAPPATVAPIRPVRILVAGESTAGATGGGMKTWGQATGRAQVDVIGTNGCALQQDGEAYWREGWKQPKNGPCAYLIDYTVKQAIELQPDLIILFIGSNQLSDWVLPGATNATHIGDPAFNFDQLYLNAATEALRKLNSLGIPILFPDLPMPQWDPGIQTGNPDFPGQGPIYMNDAARTKRLNELTAMVVGGVPISAMPPYSARVSNPDGTVPASIRPDGVHILQKAIPGIMDNGLEADFRASYAAVLRRVPSAARNGKHFWSPT